MTVALFPLQVLTSAPYATMDLSLPNQATLIGAPVAFQAAVVANGAVSFGGNAPVVVLN